MAAASTEPCPECGDTIVETKGSGLDMQYRVCTAFETRHGKTRAEVGKMIAEKRKAASGGRVRFG